MRHRLVVDTISGFASHHKFYFQEISELSVKVDVCGILQPGVQFIYVPQQRHGHGFN